MRRLYEFIRDVADDERIPLRNRVVLGGLLMYLLTPIDILPDFIPILGWLDDAFVSLVILDYVFNSADTELILQHYPWNKNGFQQMRTYVARLSWLVPSGIKTALFRQAKKLALSQKSSEQLTPES